MSRHLTGAIYNRLPCGAAPTSLNISIGDCHDWCSLKSKTGLPVIPPFVITSITPPADCAPYIAADASFSTEIVAISLGSSLFKPSGSALATPSITISAELLR